MGDIYHAGEVYAGSVPIDDTQASEKTVYSSAKVENMMEETIASSTKISLLWTNPNPGNDWDSAVATLSSDDYDFLVISFFRNKTSQYENTIQMMNKTNGKFFPEMIDHSNGNIVLYYRTCNKNSTDSKKINIGNCSKAGDASNTYNHILIPYKIYGVKM